MKMYAVIQNAKPEVVVSHGDRSISFSASVFTRRAFDVDFDVFEHINRYWSRISPVQQQEIFDIYEQVYGAIDQIRRSKDLCAFLNEKIKELVQLHPLRFLEDVLALEAGIQIPASCKESYQDDVNDNNTRDKTYTALDYRRLLTFSFFLRTLVPIWGEYINSTRRDTGMEYKEYAALQLLTGTGLLESEAARKLMLYIVAITKERHYNLERIANGVSSEDMGFMLFSLVCVRRLCVGDLRAKDEKTHLVALIYKFLFQKVFNPSESGGTVMEKRFIESPGSDSRKYSILEGYRKRAEISTGEIQEFELAMSDPYALAIRLAPTISKEEIDLALSTMKEHREERLGKPQLDLLAWTFKSIISPRSIQYVSKAANFRQLAALEAVLRHWGHPYLAIVATSHAIVGRDEIHITSVDSRGQIPLELQTEIFKHYPLVWSNYKRSTQTLTQEPHPILQSIDLFVDELMKSSWRSTAHESKILEVFGDTRRRLPILSSIKSDLARLIIDIENRR